MIPHEISMKRLTWFAEDLESIATQINNVVDEYNRRYVPHYARDSNAKEDIANGKQMLLRDFV